MNYPYLYLFDCVHNIMLIHFPLHGIIDDILSNDLTIILAPNHTFIIITLPERSFNSTALINRLSRQHFKSVAADTSRSSVEGTIFVAKHAQQTNAYQLTNNLMLSDEARADSKPRLMIYADDVKCSHGATSGKLDQAQQFYLDSRGLTPKHARALLTVAFIAEVLEKSGKSDKAGNANNQADGFRTILDHALLDTLRHRLPDAPLSKPKSLRGNGNG